MRWLGLYVRSRQLPAALGLAVAVALALRFVDRVGFVLALGVGVAVFGTGLGGADIALDRTAAVRWPPRRCAHVCLVTAVVAAVVTGTGIAPVIVVLRDAAGFAGLTAFGATVLGRQLAWCLPVAWAVVAAFVPAADPPLLRVLTWPAQQPDMLAGVTAAVLGSAGVLAYAFAGARQQRG
ncbi:MAG TPA: hypothetical protein VHF06_00195 [Pseudonocardiaceae bacterium]|nr:hypothetical protein [Pseudonocardiaceae bacterium]